MLKGEITTPLGKIANIRQSHLEPIKIPYVTESGKVGEVFVRKLYLDQVLDNLSSDLQLTQSMIMDNSREIVIVADVDVLSDDECMPCFYGTTRNLVNMENFRRLEANVIRCQNESLDSLPLDLIPKWIEVLNPIFEQARTVISRKKPEHP